jgi:sialate O-acetylesterase
MILLVVLFSYIHGAIKVACVGASTTYGAFDPDTSYVWYLRDLLGDGYEVGKFGVNGATALRAEHVCSGCTSFWSHQEYPV